MGVGDFYNEGSRSLQDRFDSRRLADRLEERKRDRIDDDELDRILGSLYAWVEQFFRPALRIGFASHFSG